MLRMCGTTFESVKAVVLNSVFFVAKVITDLKSKGVYVADLIKNRRYWPKRFRGDLIDTHFEDKDVGNVIMMEAIT